MTVVERRVRVISYPAVYTVCKESVDYDTTREVLAAFEREGVTHAIFGAVALNLHGLARATQDLDIFIEPTEENVARLQKALMRVFDDPHIDEITATDRLRRRFEFEDD